MAAVDERIGDDALTEQNHLDRWQCECGRIG
jgi:hypothetical protein